MKLIPALFFLFALTSFNFKDRNAVLICTLTSDKTVYKLGEVPKFRVRLINQSNKEIYLIGSLDGSDVKRRMPFAWFIINKPKIDTVIFSRCGTTNPLRTEDFKLLKPKEGFDPFESVDNAGFFPDHTVKQKESFRNPGTYRIRYHYSTNADNILNFIGNMGQLKKGVDSFQIKNLFEKVPKVDVESNEIEIMIRE